MIKALLLDADGVLINVEGQMASRHFEEKYNISHKLTVDFYQGPFTDCKVGKKDMFDVLPSYLKKWGWQKSASDFVNEWFEFEKKLNTQLIDYIRNLRKKGIGCWLATNQEKHRAEYFMETLGLNTELDGAFVSAHLGYLKPAKEFFTTTLNNLKLAPAEVVFWDDSQENVDAAASLGIHSEIYKNFQDFRIIMDSYLNNVEVE